MLGIAPSKGQDPVSVAIPTPRRVLAFGLPRLASRSFETEPSPPRPALPASAPWPVRGFRASRVGFTRVPPRAPRRRGPPAARRGCPRARRRGAQGPHRGRQDHARPASPPGCGDQGTDRDARAAPGRCPCGRTPHRHGTRRAARRGGGVSGALRAQGNGCDAHTRRDGGHPATHAAGRPAARACRGRHLR